MEFVEIKFLTPKENVIYNKLKECVSMFDEISTEDPQDPADTYNFGHYIDAAISAVLLRGARRMDIENLLNKNRKNKRVMTNDSSAEGNRN